MRLLTLAAISIISIFGPITSTFSASEGEPLCFFH
jgi:hypothetical protein